MKKIISITIFVFTCTLSAQTDNNASTTTKPLEKLSFMRGTWEGDSEMQTRNGKSSSQVKEIIACKLDCNIMVAEGLGTKTDPETNETQIVHNAFGVIFYDPATKSIMIRAYKDGNETTSEIEIIAPKKIRWVLNIPNGGQVRFTSDYSEENKWHETGEFSRDGKTFNTFLTMDLTKVSD